MEFVLVHPDTGTKTILVLFDGVPYEADSDHPWWNEIVDLVLDDDLRALDLFPLCALVQQPSAEVEVGPEPDEETAAKALLFESAIRTYAEHIWNDLKRVAGSS